MFSGLLFSSAQKNSWNSRIRGKEMSELKAMEDEGKTGREIGTAIQGLRDRNLVTEERLLGQLFRGYFNNKMTVLIFLTQVKKHKPEARGVNGVCCFLDDLYHHMLANPNQKQYRRVFLWLKKFVQKLPNVKASQRSRALDFVKALYEVFGINLKSEITGG